MVPSFIIGKKMDVSVRNVSADNFPEGASSKFCFQMLGEFLYGAHKCLIVFVGKIVDFVDFLFGYNQGMTFGLWVDVEKGDGLIVFVDFVARNFALDDFSEDAGHAFFSLWLLDNR